MKQWSGILVLSLLLWGLSANDTVLQSSLADVAWHPSSAPHPAAVTQEAFDELKSVVNTLVQSVNEVSSRSLESRLDEIEARLASLEERLTPSQAPSGRRLQTASYATKADLSQAVRSLQTMMVGNATQVAGYSAALIRSFSQTVSQNISSLNAEIAQQYQTIEDQIQNAVLTLEDNIMTNRSVIVSSLALATADLWHNVSGLEIQMDSVMEQLHQLNQSGCSNGSSIPVGQIDQALQAALAQIQMALASANAQIMAQIQQALGQLTGGNQTMGPLIGLLLGLNGTAIDPQTQAILQQIVFPLIGNLTGSILPWIPLLQSLNGTSLNASQSPAVAMAIVQIVSTVVGQLNGVATSLIQNPPPGLDANALAVAQQVINQILSVVLRGLNLPVLGNLTFPLNLGDDMAPIRNLILSLLNSTASPDLGQLLALLGPLANSTNFTDPQKLIENLDALIAQALSNATLPGLNITLPQEILNNPQALSSFLTNYILSALQGSLGSLGSQNPQIALLLAGLLNSNSTSIGTGANLASLLALLSGQNPILSQLLPLLNGQLPGLNNLQNLTSLLQNLPVQIAQLEQQLEQYVNQTVVGPINQFLQTLQLLNSTLAAQLAESLAQISNSTGLPGSASTPNPLLNAINQIFKPLTDLLGSLSAGSGIPRQAQPSQTRLLMSSSVPSGRVPEAAAGQS